MVVLAVSAIALKEGVSGGAVAGVLLVAAGVLLVGLGALCPQVGARVALPLRDVWFGLAIGAVILAGLRLAGRSTELQLEG